MKEPLDIGIVGAGFMGGVHADVVTRNPSTRLTAVADVDEPAARRLADRHDVRAFSSMGALLNGCAPDLVVIATRPATHVQLVEEALSRGVCVLVEKPFCLSGTEFQRIQAATGYGARVFYAENLLFAPRWQRTYAQLGPARNRITRAQAVFRTDGPHASWLADPGEGGLLFDLASHAVATCLYALPRTPVAEVQLTLAQYAPVFGMDTLVEAGIVVRLQSGQRAVCEVSWASGEGEVCRLEVLQETQVVSCDMGALDAVASESVEARAGALGQPLPAWIREGGYVEQLEAAVADLRNIAAYPIDLQFASAVIQVLQSAAEAAERNGAVRSARRDHAIA